MIVGATHPGVLTHAGESYRESLIRKIEEKGLTDHVVFHNRYLDNEELHDYLKACDIYVTPYPQREQISSGTIAYAAGMGKAVVSTVRTSAPVSQSRPSRVQTPSRDPIP